MLVQQFLCESLCAQVVFTEYASAGGRNPYHILARVPADLSGEDQAFAGPSRGLVRGAQFGYHHFAGEPVLEPRLELCSGGGQVTLSRARCLPCRIDLHTAMFYVKALRLHFMVTCNTLARRPRPVRSPSETSRTRPSRWLLSCTASRIRRTRGGISGQISPGVDTGWSRRGYPGYDAPASKPVSAGTYVRSVLDVRRQYRADDRAVLVGHDWGANAGYGAVATDPAAFGRFVALAVPPVAALVRGSSATRNSSGRSTSGSSSRWDLPKPGCSSRGSGNRSGRTGRRVTTPVKTSLNCDDMCQPTTSPTSSAPTVRPSTRISPILLRRPKPPQRCSRRRCRRCTCTVPTTEQSAPNCSTTCPHIYRPRDRRSKSSTVSVISCTWRNPS